MLVDGAFAGRCAHARALSSSSSNSSFFGFVVLLLLIALAHFAHPQRPEHWEKETDATEWLLCRSCGADAADSRDLRTRLSPNAAGDANATLFGRPRVNVQALTNPLGVSFRIVTAERALCEGAGAWVRADSWFPGRAWKYCVCPRCTAHLGWLFEPVEIAQRDDRKTPSARAFYGLVLDKLVGEKYAKSLTPQSKLPAR